MGEGRQRDPRHAAIAPAAAPRVLDDPVGLRVAAPADDDHGVGAVGVAVVVVVVVDGVAGVEGEVVAGVEDDDGGAEEHEVELHGGVEAADDVAVHDEGAGGGVLAADAEGLRGGVDVGDALGEGVAGLAQGGAVAAGGHAVEEAERRRQEVLGAAEAHPQRRRGRERRARAAVALVEDGAGRAACGAPLERVVGGGDVVEVVGRVHEEQGAEEHRLVGGGGAWLVWGGGWVCFLNRSSNP